MARPVAVAIIILTSNENARNNTGPRNLFSQEKEKRAERVENKERPKAP